MRIQRTFLFWLRACRQNITLVQRSGRASARYNVQPMRMISNRCVLLFLGALSACRSGPDSRQAQLAPPDARVPSEVRAPAAAKEPAADKPLIPGHVVFSGMVRPTKGGYEVHGVIIDDGALKKALAATPGRDAKDADWFLGAVLRLEGELRGETAPPAPVPGEPILQQRSGPSLQLMRIDVATIVKPAEVIEGTLARSKGFFALAGHLLGRHDLAWSLAPQGGREGDRVRLYGQSRTVVCEPNAQCLIGGSLPLFDIGRAERLP
jgi:hypothetical protein